MTNQFYLSSVKSLLESYKSNGDLNEQDWVVLRRCDSQQNCETYIDRFKGTEHSKLIPLIKKINLRYRSKIFSPSDPFDAECLICVLDYEDIRGEIESKKYTATRVRQSGNKRGWKRAIENIVTKKGTTDGFDVLCKGKRLDASFEAFVLENKDQFPSNVIDAAKTRLSANGYASGT
jgi:hypothetical protein